MNSTKDCSRIVREWRKLNKGTRRGWATTGRPIPQDKLGLQQEVSRQPKLKNLDMQIQGSQKLPNERWGES